MFLKPYHESGCDNGIYFGKFARKTSILFNANSFFTTYS